MLRARVVIHYTRRIAVAAALCLPLCVTVQAQDGLTAPRASLLVSSLDLGSVSMSVDDASAPQTSAAVRVVAATYWQLAIERQPAARLEASSDDWYVNIDGSWQPLLAGVPVAVASGEPTPAEGVLLNVQLLFKPSFAMAPGARRDVFSFVLDGRRSELPLQVDLSIPATTLLEDDHRSFSVVADRPSDRAEYDFNPRTFSVRSNVPWIVEVWTPGKSDRPYVIEVLDRTSTFRPLRDAIVVAAGGPTGAAAVPVVVRLRVELAPNNVAGVYTNDVGVRARALAVAPQ